jgi:hypothetical protein
MILTFPTSLKNRQWGCSLDLFVHTAFPRTLKQQLEMQRMGGCEEFILRAGGDQKTLYSQRK